MRNQQGELSEYHMQRTWEWFVAGGNMHIHEENTEINGFSENKNEMYALVTTPAHSHLLSIFFTVVDILEVVNVSSSIV